MNSRWARRHRGVLITAALLAVVLSGLYAIYSSMSGGDSDRYTGLGELLESGEGATVSTMEWSEANQFAEWMRGTAEWASAEELLASKGFDTEGLQTECYRIEYSGLTVNLSRATTATSENGSLAEVVLAVDDSGIISAWILVTNLPPETASGMDPSSKNIPVYAFSNGMPVFFVNLYHLVDGVWGSSRYWWHDSHDHPNWYYSQYDYWWWYYEWHDIPWVPWYDWFFSWYYGQRFYYWSTWFPIDESSAALGLALLLAASALVCRRP